MNLQFEKNKLQRELDRSGKQIPVFRQVRNQFNELRGDGEQVGTILGLYHEVNGFVQSQMADGTTQTKGMRGSRDVVKQPMVLCLYESVTAVGLQRNDQMEVNGKRYNVINVTNVQEWNIIADISLEVVGDGI
jgi:hypothetical protein